MSRNFKPVVVVKYYLSFGYYHIAGSNSKFKTVKELKEFAKNRAKGFNVRFERLKY